jgi:hypothetical protein
MKLFDNLFSNRQNALSEKAEKLVYTANAFAVSLFVPTLDKFSILSEIDTKNWDFIVTVASVFIASNRLRQLKLDNKQEEYLMDLVARSLNEWDPDGIGAFNDCKNLFEKEYYQLAASSGYQKDNKFLAADALGIWIVWNLFQRQPKSSDEINLLRVIGSTVISAFFSWWNK